MHRPEQITVCKQDCPTSRDEDRLDGIYEEFYNADCSTYWKNTSPICIEGKPTGNQEQNQFRYRIEYSHADCSTYWGDWIKTGCEQGKLTGSERRRDGWIQHEYYNADCSTDWKNVKRIDRQRETNGNTGCWEVMGFIPFVIFLIIPIWLAIQAESIFPLIFAFGFPLFFYLLSLILRLLERFPRVVTWATGGFSGLIGLLVVISLINGIASFFNSNNWHSSAPDPNLNPEEETWEREYENTTWSEDTYSATEDTLGGPRRKINIRLNWNALDGQSYKGSYYLYEDEIEQSTRNLQALKNLSLADYGTVYSRVYDNDKDHLSGIYTMLDSIKTANKLGKKKFAEVITSMVQSIDYVLVIEAGCDDPITQQDEEFRKMLQSGIGCNGNAPFGITTPLEFLSSMNGDCDSRTLLLYTLFKHYRYDVAIINSEFYEHSMLGLNVPGARGMYIRRDGVKYYFWETTNKGYSLGELSREMGMLSFWEIELN
jgi:hypothetical protein